MGHKDASITLRVYAHWVPNDSRREADLLDALHQDATQAQPVGPVEAGVVARVVRLLKKSGEPKFRELEPDYTMVEAARHVAHGSVTRLPYPALQWHQREGRIQSAERAVPTHSRSNNTNLLSA